MSRLQWVLVSVGLCAMLLLAGVFIRKAFYTADYASPTHFDGKKAIVSVQRQKQYYLVNIDEGTPQDIGTQYAMAIKPTGWTTWFDAYLTEMVGSDTQEGYAAEITQFHKRAQDLLPSLTEAQRVELLAFAETAADAKESILGDGKLSKEEIIVYNFFPEVVRAMACSAISACGAQTGNSNLVGRVLDWPSGENQELNNLNAVVIRKNGLGTSTLSIGYLGYLPVLTALNSKGIFTALFDCQYNAKYQSKGKRSFAFDLRSAIESASSIEDVTKKIAFPELRFPFAFNSLVADGKGAVAIENASPIGAYGAEKRLASSPLNGGISWQFSNALAVVNSNVLKGHTDNHTTASYNFERWNAFKTQFTEAAKDDKITFEEIKTIVTHHKNPGKIDESPENIYGLNSQYIVLWDSAHQKLQVWFRQPDDDTPPLKPVFEDVPLPWAVSSKN